ncbi:NfeD family protein [Pelagibacterium halotolerans]|uniref:Putative activity regulator of membrane protease YbbK n=1 Tax=Pelagibacterium halotolerans (strain DSM 22347 / JCM 15775 / CGMCC 1.7692 / B2) TaxID=1082931 RepID=G4RCA2_PELHB|nr:NfeD family protein [Pelagibacterium halotolerans]AEQ52725.1 putative activity regulator of membrane protease YbbK [Pelagibacterium halotolerans B2]QJR17572.1 NfeD family protein [Pelagibacterium halotolerans]
MDIIALIGENAGWAWLIFGLVLLGAELLVPGVFMVWLGGAALLTGLTVFQTGIGWPLQWGLFGILSVALVSGWLAYSRRRHGDAPPSEDPLINARTARLLGRETALVEAISDGVGRVRIDDTLWRVSGPDLPAGSHVRITGARGGLLEVEAVG